MPRIGMNPLMGTKGIHQPENITVAIIVHIPMLFGYWEQALDVLKICIRSVRENTDLAFDLMIFDNASCTEVQQYLVQLQKSNTIQYLILSDQNVGKLGAWNMMLAGAPSKFIAYADSDVLFLPGWLECSLEVLKAFPEAGMVTAQPPAIMEPELNSTALAKIENDDSLIVEKGILIPENYRIAQRRGVGQDNNEGRYQQSEPTMAIRVTRGEVAAYVHAGHFQFLAPKLALTSLLPLQITNLVGRTETQFDRSLNASGYWRLSTTDYLVHHMGNRVPTAEDDYDGLNWLDVSHYFRDYASLPPKKQETGQRNAFLHYVLCRTPTQKLLKRVNRLTFDLLNRTERYLIY